MIPSTDPRGRRPGRCFHRSVAHAEGTPGQGVVRAAVAHGNTARWPAGWERRTADLGGQIKRRGRSATADAGWNQCSNLTLTAKQALHSNVHAGRYFAQDPPAYEGLADTYDCFRDARRRRDTDGIGDARQTRRRLSCHRIEGVRGFIDCADPTASIVAARDKGRSDPLLRKLHGARRGDACRSV